MQEVELYGDLINPEELREFRRDIAIMKSKIDSFRGTWIERNPFLRELVLWYYERKFLNKVKKLTRGIKHS